MVYIVVLVLFAVGVTIYYFVKRREVVKRLLIYYDVIKNIGAKDVEYILLGGYVGFRAIFRELSETVRQLEITVTTHPSFALFWLPMSKIINKSDKIYFLAYLNDFVPEDFHVLDVETYSRTKIDEMWLLEDVLTINGKEFVCLYEKKEQIHKYRKLLEKIRVIDNLKHFAVCSRIKTVYFYFELSPHTVGDIVSSVIPLLFSFKNTAL